jgi:hypothetical protein
MKFALLTKLCAAGALLTTLSINAQALTYINPVSPDGPGKDLQTLLNNRGFGINVNLDQLNAQQFVICDPSHLDILVQVAGDAAEHKIGYYQPVGTLAAPTFVVGGSGSGLPQSDDFSVNGAFGLALLDGVTNDLWRTESALNSDHATHAVVFPNKKANGIVQDCSYLIAWEDRPIPGSDQDYNDIVVQVNGVQAVPEPGAVTMLACALPILGLCARRRLRK